MKNKKNLIILLPALAFVLTFILVSVLNKSFALNSDKAQDPGVIPAGTVYKMVRKNIYSWHLITHNFSSFSSTNASGTKLIKTKSAIGGKTYQAVVYCATEGKTLSSSSNRTRYPLNSSKVTSLSAAKKTKLTKVMPYMYPYINLGATSSDEETLKSILKNGIPTRGITGLSETVYNNYQFNNLTAQEAITAVQAAIWNIQKGKTTAYYAYRGTITSFSAFNECSEFKTSKVITSEEQRWYDEGGCSGNFKKYLVNHTKDSNTKNRINTLINWYLTLSNANITTEEQNFKIANSVFDSINKTLTVTVDTNISTYSITFKDDLGNTLSATKNNNEYVISNIDDAATSVTWSVSASSTNKNIYYYKASSGQDFIGLEHGTYVNNDSIIIDRTTKKGNIIIYKVAATEDGVTVKEQSTSDFDNSNCNGNCLSNAKFELYYGDENNKLLYQEIETDYSKDDTNTYTNLNSVVFKDLPLGTYYLRETQPSYGYDIYGSGTTVNYQISSGNSNATIGNDGFIKIELTEDATIGIIVNNTKTKICFMKLDGTTGTKVLSNAIYQIEDIDGMVVNQFETSEQEGMYCLNGELQTGSYFLQEIKSPSGYSLDTTRYHFTVGRGDNDISDLEDIGTYKNIVSNTNNVITLVDKREVEISKSDAATGACVKGAELVIRDSKGNIVTDSNGVEIGRWISTCDNGDDTSTDNNYTCTNGYAEYNENDVDDENSYICNDTEVEKSKDSYKISLEPGTYTLTETMTEELRKQGYSSESETITFVVDENGKVEDKIDMKDAPINVCLYKVSKGSKTPLAGATFNLYEEDGTTLFKTITTTDTPSNDCLVYVPFGNYVIKEIKAPNGYKPLNEEIKIEVKDTKEKQYFYIENEVIAPKTSLDTTKLLIIISSIFMVFGIGMVGYYGFKKKN